MSLEYIFSSNKKKPSAILRIKKYNYNYILERADYFIENLDLLDLDLLPEDFFHQFEHDLDWNYITISKTMSDDFIFKFIKKINFSELGEFYPHSINLLNKIKESETNTYLNPFRLIENCNVDDDGVDFFKSVIIDEVEDCRRKSREENLDLRVKYHYLGFPYQTIISHILKEIEEDEMFHLIKVGMRQEFKKAMIRKNNFSNSHIKYKPLWEPETLQ